METAHGHDDGPAGLSFGERLHYLADCLERGDLSRVDEFSAEEVLHCMIAHGHADPDLIDQVRMMSEAGLAFFFPEGREEEDDEEFLAALLPKVFPALEEWEIESQGE